jgi:hypothetical protein
MIGAGWVIAELGIALACAGAIWLYQRRTRARKQHMLRALRTTPDKPAVIKKSDADVVREIVNQSLAHGMEILSLVELLEAQNTGGVNKNLAEADLGNSLIVVRNAMMARLVLLVAREFSKPLETDKNLHRAVNLLRTPMVREIFSKNPEALAEAVDYFKKCKGDHRLQKIRHFRDKFTAHTGEPEEIPLPAYKELFSFARETVRCIDQIASATGLADKKIEDNIDAKKEAVAFWAPWAN